MTAERELLPNRRESQTYEIVATGMKYGGRNSPRRNISEEDARQIVENVTGFFAILAGWSRAELSAPANEPIASGNKEADHDR
jgi:hypothetical protein